MGFVNLPSVDDIQQQKDPKQQMEMLINTLGILMKELGEINGYITTSNVKELHAKVIKAGTVTAEKMDVQELSAITANMGKLTSGEIYGAYIATREGAYPRTEMSNTEDLFGAYTNANKFISIEALNGGSGSPAIIFVDSTVPISAFIFTDTVTNQFNILSTRTIQISALPGGNILLNGNNVLINGVNFASKADKSSVNGTVYVSATAGGVANIPISFSNGVRTS